MQYQPPHQSHSILNQLPQYGLIPKPPPKQLRVIKCGMYISAAQAHENPVMRIDSYVSTDLNLTCSMVIGVPTTPSSSLRFQGLPQSLLPSP
jgi:hypothetical protein